MDNTEELIKEIESYRTVTDLNFTDETDSDMKFIEEQKYMISMIVNETNRKYKAVKEEKGTMEKVVDDLRSKYNDLVHESEILTLELNENEALLSTLEMTYNDLRCGIEGLQKDISACHKKTKPSSRDIELLENCRKRLRAYKRLTGLRWNHAGSRFGSIKGYICNKETSYIKYFDLLEKEIDVTEKLWEYFQVASSVDWSDLY